MGGVNSGAGALRRKLTLTLHGRKIILIKKAQESLEHVLGKASILAIYGTTYPEMQVEVPAGDRYKPDLLATNEKGEPVFWAEVGTVKRKKIEKLLRRYPETHFVFARHRLDPAPFIKLVRNAATAVQRDSLRPVEVIGLPPKKERYLTDEGGFELPREAYTLIRVT